jgi:hypothetical protein
MNQKFWVYQMNHYVSNSLVFFMLSESNANINVQATQVLRCMICHTFDNSIGSHSSTKSQKNFLSHNLEHSTISMKKHVAHEHGPKLLKYVVHKNVLKNTTHKRKKTKHRASITPSAITIFLGTMRP